MRPAELAFQFADTLRKAGAFAVHQGHNEALGECAIAQWAGAFPESVCAHKITIAPITKAHIRVAIIALVSLTSALLRPA